MPSFAAADIVGREKEQGKSKGCLDARKTCDPGKKTTKTWAAVVGERLVSSSSLEEEEVRRETLETPSSALAAGTLGFVDDSCKEEEEEEEESRTAAVAPPSSIGFPNNMIHPSVEVVPQDGQELPVSEEKLVLRVSKEKLVLRVYRG